MMHSLLGQPVHLDDARPGDLIGFRKTGQPIYLIAGGDENGQQGGGDNGGGGGTNGSLLEEEASQGGGGQNDDGGQGGGGQGGSGGQQGGGGQQQGGGQQGGQQSDQQIDVGALVGQLEERLGARFDAIADRRVNALLKEMRNQGGQGGGQQGGGGSGGQGDGGGQGQGGQQQQSQVVGPDQGVVRSARLAYREYVGDQITFLSAEERALASDLASAAITEAVIEAGQDADDDRIGRTVAGEVAERLRTIRKHYEDKTVAALRRRGALKDVDLTQQGAGQQQGGQQPAGSPARPGDQSTFAAGAERAKARYADRIPATASQS